MPTFTAKTFNFFWNFFRIKRDTNTIPLRWDFMWIKGTRDHDIVDRYDRDKVIFIYTIIFTFIIKFSFFNPPPLQASIDIDFLANIWFFDQKAFKIDDCCLSWVRQNNHTNLLEILNNVYGGFRFILLLFKCSFCIKRINNVCKIWI